MRVQHAFFFLLFGTLSLNTLAAPNYAVRQEGRDLFVHFKEATLADHVIAKLKSLNPSAVAITVLNHEADTTFVQFFEFFDDAAAQPEQVTQFEDMLEGTPIQAQERFVRLIPRLPHIPTEEEIDQRRAAHVAQVVYMARNPEGYTTAAITATIQEHAQLALMPRQREAVLGRLRPGEAPTREDVDAMVQDLDRIQLAIDLFVQQRPAYSVLGMLEALGSTFYN